VDVLPFIECNEDGQQKPFVSVCHALMVKLLLSVAKRIKMPLIRKTNTTRLLKDGRSGMVSIPNICTSSAGMPGFQIIVQIKGTSAIP